MNWMNFKIEHDGGQHEVEIEVEGEQAVISFGASFTLRVDEENLDKLRDMLYEASRTLAIQRSCNAA
jgi:hypothetical protein